MQCSGAITLWAKNREIRFMAKRYEKSLTLEQAIYILDMRIARKFRQWWPIDIDDQQSVVKRQEGITRL